MEVFIRMNFNWFALAASSASGSTQAEGGNMWYSIAIFGVFIVIMYFVLIRPQSKKRKQEEAIRNNVQVGDEIITIGGIYGRVISIKEDSVIIESSNDRSKNRIAKWAIQTNLSVREEPKKDSKKELRRRNLKKNKA